MRFVEALGIGALLGLGLPGLLAAQQGDAVQAACDGSTPLTLLGVDTRGAAALLALPNGAAIELQLSNPPHAVWIPASARQIAGASSGPGPLFVVHTCGPNCLQPARVAKGGFETYGEALVAPATATVAATYDTSGTPWIVLHEPGGAGVLDARAFRYAGGEWRPSGRLRVTDVGSPGAHAIPSESDAITSGTGLFRAGDSAGYWLQSLPDLPAGRRGAVLPLGGSAALDIAADGVVYRTGDRGATWRKALWTPWSATVVQIWTAGKDYEREPAAGDLTLPFPVVWFDRRDPKGPERIVLSTLNASGEWTSVATVPATIESGAGDGLEIDDVLRLPGERWALIAGCSDAGEVVVRLLGGPAGAKNAGAVVTLPIKRFSP